MKTERTRTYAALLLILGVGWYLTGMLLALRAGSFGEGNLLRYLILPLTSRDTPVLLPVCIFLLGAGWAAAIHVSYRRSQRTDPRGFLYASDRSYGDARPETPSQYREVAQIRAMADCKGIILGQLTEDGSRCIDYNPYNGRANSHMLVIGTSGSGKSYTFVKSNLYQAEKRRHSVIVTDPDGGLFRDTAGFFQDRGYVVRCLNFKDLQLSDGWDCMAEVARERDRLFDHADIFAGTVMRNITSEDSVFSRAAGSLLKALLLRVLLGRDYPEDRKNIREVYRLLQNPGGMEFFETLFDRRLLQPEEWPCIEPYQSFKRASANLSGNVITELSNGLALLQNPEVCDLLSQPDIDLLLPGQEPCAYYCQFPDTHSTYRFLISLFFSLLFTALCDYADLHTEDGKLPRPVDFMLDEFPSIGILPDWHSKMAVVRKRNIQVTMIVQGIPQLQNNYKDAWIPIADNCDTTVVLSVNDPVVTAPWVSKRAGVTTIEVETYSDNGKNRTLRENGDRRNTGKAKRELFTVDEVLRLGTDDSIIFFSRHCPVLCRKTPHILHPAYPAQRRILPTDTIPFRERKKRAALREIEEQYRKQYWSTHEKEVELRLSDLSDTVPAEDLHPLRKAYRVIREDLHRLRKRCKGEAEPVQEEKHGQPAGETFAEFTEREMSSKDIREEPVTGEIRTHESAETGAEADLMPEREPEEDADLTELLGAAILRNDQKC